MASNIGLLADVFDVGDYGLASARQSYTFSTTGTYTIGFGVANALDNDSNYTSYLGVDNVAVEPVPEPLTIMGSLTAGAFGVALRRRQKQQQKAAVKA
ncbi:MAG: PEP-CTERM sorting domain-containing protein [Nostocaceae cyanobacterium]|nr:PEP-CTERM sorting domain-containing protein [Nostocaceae cyanobacterium]